MKFEIGDFALVLGIAVSACAQSALQDMVKTEQAFSKIAEEKTAREDDAWRVVLDVTNVH